MGETGNIPNDFEAEQAVLGSIVENNDTLNDVGSILTTNSFYSVNHQYIFRAMLELAEANQPIDEILLGDQLKSLNQLEEIGGYAYLAELVECAPTAGNIVYYAKIIQEHALLRDLITTTTDIGRKSRDPEQNITELLEEATEKIADIADQRDSNKTYPIKKVLARAFQNLEKVSERKDDLLGLPTGFIDLDRITLGLIPKDLIIIAARPSMGKGLKLSEPILMEDGRWKMNKFLKVGDKLASVDGKQNIVTGVFPKGKIDFYRVTFKDGRFIDCDIDHRWTIASSKWGHKRRTVDVLKLKELIMNRIRYKGRIYTEPIQGNFGVDCELGIHPWVLGALLGDGCFTKGCIFFSNTEEYMLGKMGKLFSGDFKKASESDKIRCDYRLSNGGKETTEIRFLKQTGLFGKKSPEKYVPEVIFKSSRNIREQVLAGLLETDGWVEKKHALMFSSSSEKLRDDVANLVYSLGGNAYKTEKDKVFYTYKGEKKRGLKAFKLCINLANYGFIKSPRILSRFKQKTMPYPKIIKVEYIGKHKSQCISVSHESGLYCVGGYIMTHNTALALNIASNIIKIRNKGAQLIISKEMSDEQIILRMLSAESNVHLSRIRKGDLEQDHWDKLAQATDDLSRGNFHINERANTIPEIISIARKLSREKEGISLVIVDYLQLLDGKKENREQAIAHISRSLKSLAMDLNIPVIALSQLNRSLENRTDKHPRLADLRESGSIENDADIILFIYRDEVYNDETPDKGIAEIIIAKHRNGPTGMIRLQFQGKCTRFANLSLQRP